jgi:hypothetical protein
MAKYPAAFINAIADEGSKTEAVQFLQRTWDELCEIKETLRRWRDNRRIDETSPLADSFCSAITELLGESPVDATCSRASECCRRFPCIGPQST